jgi:acetate kinase
VVAPGLYQDNKQIYFTHLEMEEGGFVSTDYHDEVKEKIAITKEQFDDSLNFTLASWQKIKIINSLEDIDVIGVRVVAPGLYFLENRIIDAVYLEKLNEAKEKAPLHMTPILLAIQRLKEIFPSTAIYGISDSAFHSTLPEQAHVYGLPSEMAEKYEIFRFGYHGISVASLVQKIQNKFGKVPARTIVCHLGGGVSVTALKDGKSIDTSMGFTPLEGLLMATRVGDIDAGAVLYLAEKENMTIPELRKYFNSQCGLLGVSEKSPDVRDLIKLEEEGDKHAKLALDLFIYRLKKYIGAYTAVLGGLDMLVFSGTIGERSFIVRRRLIEGLEILGLFLDMKKNDSTISQDEIISPEGKKPLIAVLTTDEMNQLAVETKKILK